MIAYFIPGSILKAKDKLVNSSDMARSPTEQTFKKSRENFLNVIDGYMYACTHHTHRHTNTVYIYTIKHYIALEKKEIMPFILTQIDLLDIMYSEIRQTQKKKYRMISHRYRVLQEETGGNDADHMAF